MVAQHSVQLSNMYVDWFSVHLDGVNVRAINPRKPLGKMRRQP